MRSEAAIAQAPAERAAARSNAQSPFPEFSFVAKGSPTNSPSPRAVLATLNSRPVQPSPAGAGAGIHTSLLPSPSSPRSAGAAAAGMGSEALRPPKAETSENGSRPSARNVPLPRPLHTSKVFKRARSHQTPSSSSSGSQRSPAGAAGLGHADAERLLRGCERSGFNSPASPAKKRRTTPSKARPRMKSLIGEHVEVTAGDCTGRFGIVESGANGYYKVNLVAPEGRGAHKCAVRSGETVLKRRKDVRVVEPDAVALLEVDNSTDSIAAFTGISITPRGREAAERLLQVLFESRKKLEDAAKSGSTHPAAQKAMNPHLSRFHWEAPKNKVSSVITT